MELHGWIGRLLLLKSSIVNNHPAHTDHDDQHVQITVHSSKQKLKRSATPYEFTSRKQTTIFLTQTHWRTHTGENFKNIKIFPEKWKIVSSKKNLKNIK